MNRLIVIDTNVVVALIDERDKFHHLAIALSSAITASPYDEVYLDFVVVEAIGVLCRRAKEQKRSHTLPSLLDSLARYIAPDSVTWSGVDLQRYYVRTVELVRRTQGEFNFNDALIINLCQDLGVNLIASFDTDFDQIPWLKRVTKPEDF